MEYTEDTDKFKDRNLDTNKRQISVWAASTVVVLITILFFGLYSKGIQNTVRLVADKGCLVFQKGSFAFNDDFTTHFSNAARSNGLTIELAARVGSVQPRGVGILLTISDGRDRQQLVVGQWKTAIIVMNGDDYDNSRKLPRLWAKNVFLADQTRLVTITAGKGKTSLYIDGLLASERTDWQLAFPHSDQKLKMILGKSMTGKNDWYGKIHGLAFYSDVFSPQKVSQRFNRWKNEGRFPRNTSDPTIALYTFKAQYKEQIPDVSGNGQPLRLPKAPVVFKKKTLAPVSHNVDISLPFLFDMAINLFGFIPLGVSVIGLLRALDWGSKANRAIFTVCFCFFLSLFIEMIQTWLPDRNPDTRDLMMNTLGGLIGVWLFHSGVRLFPKQ